MADLRLQVLLSAIDKITTPFRSMQNATQRLSTGITEAKKALKSLEQQQGHIEKFRELSRMSAITGNELQSAKKKAADLARQFNQTATPTKELIRQFEQAKAKVRELKDREQSLTSQQQKLREEMQRAGINVRSLSTEQQRLRQAAAAATQSLSAQREQLARLETQHKRLQVAQAAYAKTRELQGRLAGTGAGLMATGAATGALAIKPVLEFAQAEDAATGLKVSMMGAGGVVRKEFGAISDLATKLGNQLPGTTADFQNMMSTLIQQGMSAKSILGGLGQATAYLGVQMKMPYDQAAKFAAKLQDATGTAEKDMMGLMDTIQRSYYLGVDSGNMLAAFTKLSPALSVLRKNGLEASQALAPLVVMADQSGMAGEASGNAYRKIFQMSMNPDKVSDANHRMAKAGIKLNFSDGKGEFAGLDNLFVQLAKLKKLNTETRLQVLKDIYGDDAETLQALNLMIDKGLDGYKATQQKMAAQADLQSRVNAQLGTLKNLWDAASGTFTNALVAFGEAVAPEMKALVKWIGDLSERLGAWAKANPRLSNGLMKTAAVIAVVTAGAGALALSIAAALGPFAMLRFISATIGIKLSFLGKAIGPLLTVIKMLGGGLQFLGGMFVRLGIMMLTTPFGWILTAIAAIAVGAYLIYKNWDTIGPWFSKLWEGIKSAAGIAWEWLKIAFSWSPLGMVINNWGAITGWFSGLWDGIKAIASKGFEWLKTAFSWSPLGLIISNWDAITQYFSSVADNLKNFGNKFGEYLSNGINMVLAPLKDLMDGIQWVLDNISKITMGEGAVNWLNNTNTPRSAEYAQAISNNPALASVSVTDNWGQTPSVSNYQPVRATSKTTTIESSFHAPMTFNMTPGMDEKTIGKIVQKAIEDARAKERSRANGKIGDNN